MPPEPPSPVVALVVVAQTDYDHWEPLTQVPLAVRELADALSGRGYQLHQPHLLKGGTKASIERSLTKLTQELSAKDHLILYWIGHGTGNGIHHLVTRDSPPKNQITGVNALRADVLGEVIAKSSSPKVLMLLDTCYSSAGAQAIATEVFRILNGRTAPPGSVPFIGVIPSAHAQVRAQEAVFCRALLEVMTAPDRRLRAWTDQDQWIPVPELSEALRKAMQAQLGVASQLPLPFSAGYEEGGFIPNPRYRGPQAAMDVETRRLQIPEALELTARGVEVGEAGFYFTGRTRLLSDLADWLARGSGLVVLTGPPGSGKSAVLGRLVTLCAPAARRGAEEAGSLGEVPEESLPPQGAVDVAAHAKGLTLAQHAGELAEQAGIDLLGKVPFDQAELLDGIQALGQSLTVVVDALDEAAEPQEIGALLRRLVAEAGARVLVGTRRSPDGRPIPEREDRHARLRALFGDDARILDLEDEPDTSADIAAYVAARLKHDPRSCHRDDAKGIARAAQAVAERAEGVFLYARVVSRTMQEAATLDTATLPVGPIVAFTEDLTTRFKDKRRLVDALLSALAWGEGGGLSRWAWPRVATALSIPGEAYDDADTVWVLDHAGFHVLEAGEAGQTVYRLAHQSFADHYRREDADAIDLQRAITKALTEEPIQP